jgi:glycosyltransferase involved in cell wall biosynthesis
VNLLKQTLRRIPAARVAWRVFGPVIRTLSANSPFVLRRRLSTLELLLLEHPDVLGRSCNNSSFSSPAISVIIPTWNRADLVGAAIRSVQAQHFSDWELIVIDDGSTDDTAEVMAAFAVDARIRYVVQPHAGQCAARNHALRIARGTFIAYLDSDNIWYPGFLASAVALFGAHPEVDCAYGAMITDFHVRGERVLFEPFDRDRLLAKNFIGMSTFVHRRELVDRLGGFDEKLGTHEDWDLVLRYTAHAPAYRLPVLAVRYRTLDDKRLSVAAPPDTDIAYIRDKWREA